MMLPWVLPDRISAVRQERCRQRGALIADTDDDGLLLRRALLSQRVDVIALRSRWCFDRGEEERCGGEGGDAKGVEDRAGEGADGEGVDLVVDDGRQQGRQASHAAQHGH